MLALVPWGVRGLYEAPAIDHMACPSTMGGEPPRAIQHPAVVGLDGLRAPVTAVGEVLGLLEYRVSPVVYRGGCPLGMQLCVCILFPSPRVYLRQTSQVMGLTHRPPHGGGGHTAWCAWLAKELDYPIHHACEFSARLMGGRMLEIQCFSLTRQKYFDVRCLF